MCALWSLGDGAAAGCRVLLPDVYGGAAWMRVQLQGAAAARKYVLQFGIYAGVTFLLFCNLYFIVF